MRVGFHSEAIISTYIDCNYNSSIIILVSFMSEKMCSVSCVDLTFQDRILYKELRSIDLSRVKAVLSVFLIAVTEKLAKALLLVKMRDDLRLYLIKPGCFGPSTLP